MRRKALVAYSIASTHVQTTRDYLEAIKRVSDYDAEYVHVTHDAVPDVDFDSYDLVFHNYCARLCFEAFVSGSYQAKLRAYNGLKVLAVQDEYDRTNTLKAAIKDLGFDIVLTCVPQDSLEYVYPKTEFPDVTFVTVFTGYVPEYFAAPNAAFKPLSERPILIGYRGRDIGGRYGRLGFDKFEIGRRMKAECDARNVSTDIAMDEASRIYGRAWFDFIGDCRAMLGSESGSNVFDFDGSIDQQYKAMTAAQGAPVSYEAFAPVVAEREREIDMGQISPRIFECAFMRTPMILYRGRYSDAIKPDVHYIPLEKDFSNVDQVLARLEDLPELAAMTARAYDHLIGSGQFGYDAFWSRLREAIAKKEASRGIRVRTGAPLGFASSNEPVSIWHLEQPTDELLPSERLVLVAQICAYEGQTEYLTETARKQRSLCQSEIERIAKAYLSALANLAARTRSAELAFFPSHIDRTAFDTAAEQLRLAADTFEAEKERLEAGLRDIMVGSSHVDMFSLKERYGKLLMDWAGGYEARMRRFNTVYKYTYQAANLLYYKVHLAYLTDVYKRRVDGLSQIYSELVLKPISGRASIGLPTDIDRTFFDEIIAQFPREFEEFERKLAKARVDRALASDEARALICEERVAELLEEHVVAFDGRLAEFNRIYHETVAAADAALRGADLPFVTRTRLALARARRKAVHSAKAMVIAVPPLHWAVLRLRGKSRVAL